MLSWQCLEQPVFPGPWLMPGCFERSLFPAVSRSALALAPELAVRGNQGRCGALHAHSRLAPWRWRQGPLPARAADCRAESGPWLQAGVSHGREQRLGTAALVTARVSGIAGKRFVAGALRTAGDELGGHLDRLHRAGGARLQRQGEGKDDNARDEQRP